MLSRFSTIVSLALGASVIIAAQAPEDAFRSWAKTTAIAVSDLEPGGKLADSRALKELIGTARVVALGEPFHGGHEPLAFRNRLAEFLIREMGFTAIALETAMSPSKPLDDFVRTGAGTPEAFAPQAIGYNFDKFAENLELIRAIRSHNVTHPNTSPVRLYGSDLTGSFRNDGSRSLVALVAYLDRVDPTAAPVFRTRLAPFMTTFNAAGMKAFDSQQRDALTGALTDLLALLQRRRLAFISASSPTDYEWAVYQAVNARQDDVAYRAESPDLREFAMAENVRQILAAHGPSGRVLYFSHNNHARNTLPATCADQQKLPNGAMATGTYLRSIFGRDLIIIGAYFGVDARPSDKPPAGPGRLESLFATAASPKFLLDFRKLPAGGALRDAFHTPYRTRSTAVAEPCQAPPAAAAYDAAIYFDRITPARTWQNPTIQQ